MNGSKFSSSLPFLILGYFSRCVSTIPKKWIYEQLAVIWDTLSLPKEVVNVTQYPHLIAVSWPSLLVWAQCRPKLRHLHDYQFGVSLCPTGLEHRKSCQPTPFHVDLLWMFSGQLQDFSSPKHNKHAGNMKHFTSPWPFMLWASVLPFIFHNYWKTGTEIVWGGSLVVFYMPLDSPSFPCL